MILTRATEHLKQQRWTAVVIALMVVFLGMQVSSWNQSRVDR